jgi:hypothetical protein
MAIEKGRYNFLCHAGLGVALLFSISQSINRCECRWTNNNVEDDLGRRFPRSDVTFRYRLFTESNTRKRFSRNSFLHLENYSYVIATKE